MFIRSFRIQVVKIMFESFVSFVLAEARPELRSMQYGGKSAFSEEALVRLLLLRLTKVSNCPSTELSAHVHLISLVGLVVNELQE